MPLVNEDFLLHNQTARDLYHQYAEGVPILDYHCHLPAQDIAANRRFRNLFEIWLEGDHYKWRAMRAQGIAERYCTGDAAPYDKFRAWASTLPHCVRNPLYHWSQLELKRYFGIEEVLDAHTAPAIWQRANDLLATDRLTAQGILDRFQVQALCTTDDPAYDLDAHAQIAGSNLKTRVYPTFRPDGALDVHWPEAFNAWVNRLAALAGIEISKLSDLLEALSKRHEQFHQAGCRLSDHGLPYCYAEACGQREGAAIFDKSRLGKEVTEAEHRQYASYMMRFFARLDAEKGWTKQLHLGALRNVNPHALKTLGANRGFDSIGDWPQAQPLADYLNSLDRDNVLPKIILYNSNPADNYVFASMAGNFPAENLRGKVQYGTAWWFLDQKNGIESQINALSNVSPLANFIGMVTDSRSFMAYPRHEYFRRVLCNLLGTEMEDGLIPNDTPMIGEIIRKICFTNAKEYLSLEVPELS
jgi:glucuronate isomerase